MRWTKEENQIILEFFETLEKEELIKKLPNRTWESIMFRGNRTFKLSRKSFKPFKKGNQYRKNKEPWNKGKVFERMIGKNNPRYNGYQYISDRGYKFLKDENNTEKWSSYRPEHILVMEEHLGRKLERSKNGQGEGIHHIDGDKLNNSIDNLLLYNNEKEHKLLHCQIETLAFDLFKKGIIKFDKNTKKYYYE